MRCQMTVQTTAILAVAEMGEYRAAGADLAELRLLLHERMPAPVVNDNVGTCPAYGITLTNPDPGKWRLSVNRDGAFQGLLLEDQFSVYGEGIMVAAIDFLTSYGPQVIKMMNQEEEMSKQMLIGAGRGSAAMIGEIESERLVPIQGNMAYEAVISPNIPGVKARIQCINKSDYAIMILMLGERQTFDVKLAECDRIVVQSVQFGNPGTGTGVPPVWRNFSSR